MGKLVQIKTEDGEGLFDTDTKQLKIRTPDGGLILRDMTKSTDQDAADADHFDNLTAYIGDGRLNAIASDTLEEIQSDLNGMADRKKDIAEALRLLGLRVEETGSAVVPGQSVVRSPLLLEAVMTFQANAVSELLPASGPVKVVHFGEVTTEIEQLTEDFETDLNQWFTTVAKEYYPDTSRMLFDDVGLVGSGFKKIFNCPRRRRPVSERVASEDFIVPAGTTHISTAPRVTHRLKITQNDMKKMQALGYYRDVTLGMPSKSTDEVADAKATVQGVSTLTPLPKSVPHEVYECYCELDLSDIEGIQDDESGIARPYRVSIDKDSRLVLEVRRDWDPDSELFDRRQTFVKYPFIEAIGFYCIGLMHILGNTTEAMTAAWRLMIDAGMFASFPGFLYAKDRGKQQESMVVRVAAGTGAGIQTGGQPIQETVMPLPYKAADPAFVQLINMFEEQGRRVGQTSMTPVGEGKQDAPVGTTLALLDQATKIVAAVFKGLHAAQSEEFQLIKERFKEQPDAFWRGLKRPARDWKQEEFEVALKNCDIVPCADPNTPSHMHRLMRAVALVQMAQAFPEKVDGGKVVEAVLKILGWDPKEFEKTPDPPSTEPQQLPIDPVGMAAVKQKEKSDQLRAMIEKMKIDADGKKASDKNETDKEIAAGKLASDGKRGLQDDMLERMTAFLDFLDGHLDRQHEAGMAQAQQQQPGAGGGPPDAKPPQPSIGAPPGPEPQPSLATPPAVPNAPVRVI